MRVRFPTELGSNGVLFNPFGPNILKLSLNENIRNFLLDFVKKLYDVSVRENHKDQIIAGGIDPISDQAKSISNGRLGFIQQDHIIRFDDNNILASLIHELLFQYHAYLIEYFNYFVKTDQNKKEIEKEIQSAKPNITDIWWVLMKEGDFHIPHHHKKTEGCSGAIYLDIPEHISYPEGCFTLFEGSMSGLEKSTHYTHQPKSGDVLIWPNWLVHSVSPFKGDGERWMISFNGNVKHKKENIK